MISFSVWLYFSKTTENQEIKKQDEQRFRLNRKVEEQNKLNEKLYLIALKFGVEPQKTKAILNEYFSETRDSDFYELDPDFWFESFSVDSKPIDYQAVIERISYQQGISKETVAAMIIEFKA